MRAGAVALSTMTAKSFNQDMHFMLIEIVGDKSHFQVISRTGKTIDSGTLTNERRKNGVAST